MKLKNSATVVGKIVAAGMLIGAVGHHRYDYYTLLRWVVCGVAGFAGFQAAQAGKVGWAWVLAVVALAFNPVVPVRLKRDSWALIDIAVAATLLVSIAAVDWRTPPE